MDDNSIYPGQYFIEFIGRDGAWIQVDKVVVNHLGMPLYIISDNTYYNWSTIISMRTYSAIPEPYLTRQ